MTHEEKIMDGIRKGLLTDEDLALISEDEDPVIFREPEVPVIIRGPKVLGAFAEVEHNFYQFQQLYWRLCYFSLFFHQFLI